MSTVEEEPLAIKPSVEMRASEDFQRLESDSHVSVDETDVMSVEEQLESSTRQNGHLKVLVVVVTLVCVGLLVLVVFLVPHHRDDGNEPSNIRSDFCPDDIWESARTEGFLQICDIHYDPFYTEYIGASSLCRNVSTQFGDDVLEVVNASNAQRYGRFGCDAPFDLVELAVQEMNRVKFSPKFLLITGDLLAHSLVNIPSIQDDALETLLIESHTKVLNLISEQFPETPIFVSLGNNDALVHYTSPSLEFAEQLADLWQPLFRDTTDGNKNFDCDVTNLVPGLFYSCQVERDFHVIALNTILWNAHTPNDAGNLANLATEQLNWLRQTLEDIQQNQNERGRALLTGHIPPGVDLFSRVSFWVPEYYDEFVEIVEQYSSIITSGIYGHAHSDDFHVLYSPFDPELQSGVGKPVGTVFLNPPISVIFANTNPGFRGWLYDSSNYELLDYRQHTLDFDLANMFPDDADGSMWDTYTFKYAYQGNDQTESLNTTSLLRASLKLLGSNIHSTTYLTQRTGAYGALDDRLQFVECNLSPDILTIDDFIDCTQNQKLITKEQIELFEELYLQENS